MATSGRVGAVKDFPARPTGVVPLHDLEARVKLLAEYGVKFYKDGMLELHLEGRPARTPGASQEGFKV